jgi:hypothetical protein
LEPGIRGDPIKGHLLHVSTACNTEYEVLSYTWGSPTMHHELHTDEGTVTITAFLRSALTRIRFPDNSRVLWVDAVCINQADKNEKSGQIIFMLKIYSFTAKAVVHLGQKGDRSDLAIKAHR